MTLLSTEQQKSCQNAKVFYIRKEKIDDKHAKEKQYCKVKARCNYTVE